MRKGNMLKLEGKERKANKNVQMVKRLPLGNLRREQIQLYARVSRKEPLQEMSGVEVLLR